MAAAEVTLTGVLYDKLNRTTQQVVFIGEAVLTGLGVGGGPMPGGGAPVDPGYSPPWARPPVDPGYGIPGGIEGTRPPPGSVDPGWGVTPLPPNTPSLPPPGSPPMHVGGTQPVQPMVPPPAVIIDYPGVGKVLVPLPTAETPPLPTPTPPVAAPKK